MAVAAHERLLDLIIALTHAPRAMTREQIRHRVNGYSTAEGTRADAAFERMFERDKQTLKELGIPLVTVHGSGHYDEIRYRIDLDEYALPEVDLSPSELGALAVATRVWDGSVLARQARRGLTKLKGIAASPKRTDSRPAVKLSAVDDALPVIFDALVHNQVVQFSYAAVSTGEETQREVEPWRLRVKNNGWYLQGWDRGRKAAREFRLSRITSKAIPIDSPFTGPDPQLPNDEDEPVVTAKVAISDGSAAALRAQGEYLYREGGRDVFSVPLSDMLAASGDIAAYGSAVTVLEPAKLRERVVAKLTGAVQHGKYAL